MKKLCILILLFVLSLAFVGCSSDRRTVVKFSSWGSQTEVAILKTLLSEFEKENPEIKVEFMHAPSGYFSKLHLYFAAGMEPDVIFINNASFQKYYEEGLLENLNPYFTEELSGKVFFDKTVENFTRNGETYAIPRDVSNIVIYYNKDLFKKYGIPFPDENWELSDLYTIAKKLTADTNGDGKIDVWGINRSDKQVFWLPFVMANGGDILDSEGNLAVSNEKVINALQKYSDLVTKDKSAPPNSALSGKTYPQMFMLGELGMLAGGRWNMPQFSHIKDFDWDVINFPTGGKAFNPADSSGWAIAKRSKNKPEAIKLLKFLSSKNSAVEFTKSGLITPAVKEIAQSELFLNMPEHKNNKAFLYAAEQSQVQNTSRNMKEIEDILYSELEPAFNGRITVKEALAEEKLSKKLCSFSKCN